MREIKIRKLIILSATLIIFGYIASCNMNSSKNTSIFPTRSEETINTQTDLPTQQSVQSNMTPSPIIQTQEPQPTINVSETVLTVARSDSIVDSLLFFDQEMNLIKSSSNEYNPYLSSIECHLLSIYEGEKGFEIVTRDFYGKELSKELALENRAVEDRIYNASISPSEQWLAYLVITGDWGMSYSDAEIQDLRLLKIDKVSPQKALNLTSRGGARPNTVVWSPDSRYLAYTDFDDNGIQQIFMFDLNTNAISQISHFGENAKNEQIITLRWSFDSNHIAFATYTSLGESSHTSSAIYVYDFLKRNFQQLDLQVSYVHDNDIWWGDGLQLLINQKEFTELSQTRFGIVWFDVEKDEIIRKLSQDEIKANLFSIIPLSDDLGRILIADLPAPDVYIYELGKNELTVKEQEFMGGIYDFVKTSSGLLRSPGCQK